MTIKIQDLENLQDLTEVELEKVVGGEIAITAQTIENIRAYLEGEGPLTVQQLRSDIKAAVERRARKKVQDFFQVNNFTLPGP